MLLFRSLLRLPRSSPSGLTFSATLVAALAFSLGGCPTGTASIGGEDAGGDLDAGEPEADDAGVRDAGAAPEGEPDGGEPEPIEPDAGTPESVEPEPAEPDPSEPETPPSAQGQSYFNAVDRTLRDQALVLALNERLSDTHDRVSFDNLWNAYDDTDTGRCGAGIFDIYTDNCWTQDDRCGEYGAEGDCFNREHLWPKSWWGGSEGTDAHSDLFVVVPADGYLNGRRANLAFGMVNSATYTSSIGNRLGRCANPAVSANDCFEPAPSIRGDIARAYFYFAVRYEAEFGCCDEPAVTGADINGWQERMLREWHAEDPPDAAERARNEAVFELQGNRNPFVDYPNLVYGISDF